MSISDTQAVVQQKVWLLPVGFNIKSYFMVLTTPNLWNSYFNTIWYTVVGTLLNLVLTIMAAYPLSCARFFLRRIFTLFITITMFISGGIIPLFILMTKLGIYNTRWAIVLPIAVSAFNIILMRVYFQSSIPKELPEMATIDGCNDIGILLKVILPTSQPIIAVISLFVAVGFWNNYFSALLFLPNTKLQPVTMLLQRVLLKNGTGGLTNMLIDPNGKANALNYSAQIKYTLIIVTILPIVCTYPFFQKYFVKGIMIGAVKG
jgi:ABC-type sugar transport system, permease component